METENSYKMSVDLGKPAVKSKSGITGKVKDWGRQYLEGSYLLYFKDLDGAPNDLKSKAARATIANLLIGTAGLPLALNPYTEVFGECAMVYACASIFVPAVKQAVYDFKHIDMVI